MFGAEKEETGFITWTELAHGVPVFLIFFFIGRRMVWRPSGWKRAMASQPLFFFFFFFSTDPRVPMASHPFFFFFFFFIGPNQAMASLRDAMRHTCLLIFKIYAKPFLFLIFYFFLFLLIKITGLINCIDQYIFFLKE